MIWEIAGFICRACARRWYDRVLAAMCAIGTFAYVRRNARVSARPHYGKQLDLYFVRVRVPSMIACVERRFLLVHLLVYVCMRA